MKAVENIGERPKGGQMNIGNITSFHRFVLIAAIKVTRQFRSQSGKILFLTSKLCVKYGHHVQLSEAFTLEFIAERTSIPVPKVHCAFMHKGCTYIVMDRIKGETLASMWETKSEESKAKIFSQLRKIVDEMRDIPAPGHCISNAIGGPLYDSRFAGTSFTIGPFNNIQDFHLFIRDGNQEAPENYPEISDMIRMQDRPWPLPVFTHGDLSTFNILVHDDTVVGIIDWETAGWYPIYWEYTSARLQASPMNRWWTKEVDRFLEPMGQEVEMEALRLKYFGAFPWFGSAGI